MWKRAVSTIHRKTPKMPTVITTTVVVPLTSFLDGQEVFFNSDLTSPRKLRIL